MRWRIEVFGGVLPSAEVQAIAPIDFGTPYRVVDFGVGELDQGEHVPLVYDGVLLETRSPGSISMFGPGFPNGNVPSLHVMEQVWHVFFDRRGLEIEGLEVRIDGVAVHSRWEATPLPPSAEDEALLRQIFGESE